MALDPYTTYMLYIYQYFSINQCCRLMYFTMMYIEVSIHVNMLSATI